MQTSAVLCGSTATQGGGYLALTLGSVTFTMTPGSALLSEMELRYRRIDPIECFRGLQQRWNQLPVLPLSENRPIDESTTDLLDDSDLACAALS